MTSVGSSLHVYTKDGNIKQDLKNNQPVDVLRPIVFLQSLSYFLGGIVITDKA